MVQRAVLWLTVCAAVVLGVAGIPELTFQDPQTGMKVVQKTNQYLGLPKDHACACVNMAPHGPEAVVAGATSLLQLFDTVNHERKAKQLDIKGDGRFMWNLQEEEKAGARVNIGPADIRPSQPSDIDGGPQPPGAGQKSMFCYCSKTKKEFTFNAEGYKNKCLGCCHQIAEEKAKQKQSAGGAAETRLGFEDMKWQCKRRCKKLCRKSCVDKAKKSEGGTFSDSQYTEYRSKCMAICDQGFTALVQEDPNGENYQFLKPFTTRIFDRRYGLKYYKGERDSSIWNDRMRFVRYFLGEEENGGVEGLAHKVEQRIKGLEQNPNGETEALVKPPNPMKEANELARPGAAGDRVGGDYWKISDADDKAVPVYGDNV